MRARSHPSLRRLPTLAGLLVVAACGGAAPAPAHTPAPAPVPPAAARVRPVAAPLSVDALLATIQRSYRPGLQRCYKQHLRKEATARGIVRLSFTVTTSGRVVDGQAHGFAPAVDACITAQMRSWRFAAPTEESSFALPIQLAPE